MRPKKGLGGWPRVEMKFLAYFTMEGKRKEHFQCLDFGPNNFVKIVREWLSGRVSITHKRRFESCILAKYFNK